MNYIFGNNTLYPRSGRSGGGSHGVGPGVKQKQGPKRGSSEELPPHAAPSPSSTATTSSPAPSSTSSSSSRWQQLITFFSRRSAFADCITAAQVPLTSNPRLHHLLLGAVSECVVLRVLLCVHRSICVQSGRLYTYFLL